MKKLYFFLLLLNFHGINFAQSIAEQLNYNLYKPANEPEKSGVTERFTGQQILDYFEYEKDVVEAAGGQMMSFIRFIDEKTTTQIGFRTAVQTFDSLILTQNLQNYTNETYGNTPFIIDSIFIVLHHQNNSGQNDSLIVRIIELSPYNANPLLSYRPTNNVLWADTIFLTTSLTNPPSLGGYPIINYGIPVGYNLPINKRFGVLVTFRAPSNDSLAILTGLPHFPQTPCSNSALTGFGNLVPGELYPSAFATIINAGNPLEIPTSTGATIYYDCNGDNAAQLPDEAALKVWGISAKISAANCSVITQPTNQNASVGNSIQFTVTASDPNAGYQWQSDLGSGFVNLSNSGQYSGVNTNTLTVSNLTLANDNQTFRCIINVGSCIDTSNIATLSVCQPDSGSISGLNSTYDLYTFSGGVTLIGYPPGGIFSGPGVGGNIFDPATAGVGTHTITYTYVDSTGCTGVVSQQVTVINTVSIKKNFVLEPTIRIFPNPSNSFAEIHIENINNKDLQKDLQIDIKNIVGKTVYKTLINNNQSKLIERVNTSIFEKGIYFVVVTLNENSYTQKLIIQ